jgi:hypothetical protein
MSAKKTTRKILVSMLLNAEDHARLTELCQSRKQSKADFLRGAMLAHEVIPVIKTKPLSGACLDKHQARLKRERAEAYKIPKKEA